MPWIILTLGLVLAVGVHLARNRMLAARLPALEAGIEARWGIRVERGRVELDPLYQLHLTGTTLVLAPGTTLDLSRALLTGIPRCLVTGGREPPTLRRLEGVLRVPGGGALPGQWTIPVRYRATDRAGGGPVLEGVVEIREAFLVGPEGPRPGLGPVSLESGLVVTPREWKLVGARVTAGEVHLEGDASGPLDEGFRAGSIRVAATLEDLEIGWLLDRVRDPELARPTTGAGPGRPGAGTVAAVPVVPPGSRIRGRFLMEPGAPARFTGTAGTGGTSGSGGSRLHLEGILDSTGFLTGTRIHGQLALSDLAPNLPAGLGVLAPTGAPLECDLTLGGAWNRPVVAGKVFASRLAVAGHRRRPGPVLAVEDLILDLRIDERAVRILSMTGVTCQGRFEVAGEIRPTGEVVSWDARVEVRGMRSEAVPTGPAGEAGLAPYVRACVSGLLSLEGQGFRPERLAGSGELILDDVTWLVLRDFEPALRGYGLPALPVTGRGPARARLRIAGGRLFIEDIGAAVKDIRVEGAASVGPDGSLDGRLEALVKPGFLAGSPLLALPAAMVDDVLVPIALAGSLDRPRWSADVAGALGRLAARSRIASTVRGTMDALWSSLAIEGIRPGPDLDFLFGKILEGGSDSEGYLEKLIATGVSADEVERLLADYRNRNPG